MTPPPAGERIRVLLVEDHLVLARSLAMLLGDDPSIEVVDICTLAATAEQVAAAVRPDVLVMDLRLPDGSGAQAASRIRDRRSRPVIVFLTGDESDEALAEAVEAGGAAFITKSSAPEVLVDAIKRTHQGEVLIRPDQVQRALLERRVRRDRDREREELRSRLTSRELEVLRLLAAGVPVAGIASELGIAQLTVRTHVKSLLGKLDAHSQLEAVARAQALGLIAPSPVDVRPP